jgi:HD superfamily phosphodiesterase
LLHDIGRSRPEEGNHGQVGAELARDLLGEGELFRDEEIERICFAIANHNSVQPVEDEVALILRDADMLDQLGSNGLARCLASKAVKPFYPKDNPKGETWGLTGEQFNYRLDLEKKGVGGYIVDQINFQISRGDCLNTATARKLAQPGIEFLQNFLIGLEKELATV